MAIPKPGRKLSNPSAFSDVMQYMAHIDPDGAILDEYAEADPTEWIHSGSYILNAHVSGSLRKGWPNNKVMAIAGDPKTGKSFEIYNAVYFMQQMGYTPWIFETENAVDRSRLTAMGIDIKKVFFTQPETSESIIVKLTQFTETMLRDMRAGKPIPKIGIIIDSISALNSEKQYADALAGQVKADMGTIAKMNALLFNMMTIRCGKLGIPMFVTAHVYEADAGNFKEKKVSGGMKAIYMSSIVCLLTRYFTKDDETKERTGIRVVSHIVESRYSAHVPIELYLPFKKKMNPYLGLQDYIDWDVCGVDKGKFVEFVDFGAELLRLKFITKEDMLTKSFSVADLKKLLSKGKQENLKEQIKANVELGLIAPGKVAETFTFTKKTSKQFDKEGKFTPIEDLVGVVNKGSSQWIVKHLKRVIKTAPEFLTSEVFTPEVIEAIDVAFIMPKFQYSSASEAKPGEVLVDVPTEITDDGMGLGMSDDGDSGNDELYAMASAPENNTIKPEPKDTKKAAPAKK